MQPSKFITQGILKYVKGDVCNPRGGGHRIVVQINNDIGAYGAGVSGAIAKRWPKVEQEYRKWYRSQNNFKGGEIQIVDVQTDIAVANMIAQHGIKTAGEGLPPIRYDQLRDCMNKVGEQACETNSSIHGPRFGAGLAGGDWNQIEQLIKELWLARGRNVTIYDLE